jgi:hypothetical protein
LVTLGIVFWHFDSQWIWFIVGGLLITRLLGTVTGRYLVLPTAFFLPLLVFLVSAVVGIWAAYDRGTAWAKFSVILFAILIFDLLANQPRINLWLIVGWMSFVGVWVGGWFLLVHDWLLQPIDLGSLNQIAIRWQEFRPHISFPPFQQGMVGGILAILLPLLVVFWVTAWRSRQYLKLFILGAVIVFLILAFIMASSRAAWVALFVATMICLLGQASLLISRRMKWKPLPVFLSIVGLVVASSLALIFFGNLVQVTRWLGSATLKSRSEVIYNTLDLAEDYFYIGGGLGAFPGLYSRYILDIPYYFLGYGHNIFLDILVEQGVIGLLAFFWVYVGSFIMLLEVLFQEKLSPSGKYDSPTWMGLGWAVMVGMVVMVIIGLVDDAWYAERSTPLLFFLPGLTVALTVSYRGERLSPGFEILNSFDTRLGKRWVIALCILLLGLLALLIVLRKPLLAGWYANLGAVQMSKVELDAWPDVNPDNTPVENLKDAEISFNEVILLDPLNRTAHHRLGIIETRLRHFQTAISHLEFAQQQDPGHRGIRKLLGYNYVWANQLDQAYRLLISIPEAEEELSFYQWWWGTQGFDDLATYSNEIKEMLAQGGNR